MISVIVSEIDNEYRILVKGGIGTALVSIQLKFSIAKLKKACIDDVIT